MFFQRSRVIALLSGVVTCFVTFNSSVLLGLYPALNGKYTYE